MTTYRRDGEVMGKRPRAVFVAVLAVVVGTATMSACGGGGDKGDAKPSASGSHAASGGVKDSAAGVDPTASATPTQILAQVKGEKDMVVTINTATRDDGGFVTVEGVITNNGTSTFSATGWAGQELAVQKSGASVAGAVLVDEAGKKRYYVLRDTEGKCLCTMDLILVKPKETRPFFAQFPSPPPTTTEVEFELPTMPPAKITISEG